MDSWLNESASSINSDGVDSDGVINSNVKRVCVGCAVVCDVSSVVAIEHNIANNAQYAQVIVVSLEEIVAGEVVHLFHVGRLELEVDVGGEV